jgi:hypothetical protein
MKVKMTLECTFDIDERYWCDDMDEEEWNAYNSGEFAMPPEVSKALEERIKNLSLDAGCIDIDGCGNTIAIPTNAKFEVIAPKLKSKK